MVMKSHPPKVQAIAVAAAALCAPSLTITVPAHASAHAARPASPKIPGIRHGCHLAATVKIGQPVTGTANWLNVDCTLSKASLTVRLYQNGTQVAKKQIPDPNGTSASVSATATCVVGDTYQAKGKIKGTGKNGVPESATAKSTPVTATTC